MNPSATTGSTRAESSDVEGCHRGASGEPAPQPAAATYGDKSTNRTEPAEREPRTAGHTSHSPAPPARTQQTHDPNDHVRPAPCHGHVCTEGTATGGSNLSRKTGRNGCKSSFPPNQPLMGSSGEISKLRRSQLLAHQKSRVVLRLLRLSLGHLSRSLGRLRLTECLQIGLLGLPQHPQHPPLARSGGSAPRRLLGRRGGSPSASRRRSAQRVARCRTV